jgi:hypothetical protein
MQADPLALLDSQANVLCPACKLWNTGHGANMMREAVSLMGLGVTKMPASSARSGWTPNSKRPQASVQRLQPADHDQRAFPGQYREWVAS